jgi:DivIVA domain-containing protein
LFRRDVEPLRRLGPAYRSAAYRPLWPSQVRTRRFTPVGFRRRGVDPDEVTEFLDRVAGDLARAYAEVAGLREQNARIKDALRRWQSRQAPTARELAR